MQGIYDDAFNEVHRSNMAKLVDGKVLRRRTEGAEARGLAAPAAGAIPSDDA